MAARQRPRKKPATATCKTGRLEIDRLEAAEGASGGRELFVGGDRRGLIERHFGDSGAHHIDLVEWHFGVVLA
jgi:hypothetical protein